MDSIFRKKVIAIALATANLTGIIALKSGAVDKLPALEYDDFLNNYEIVEYDDEYNVYKNNEFIIKFYNQKNAKNYVYNKADKEFIDHTSFSEDFRKLYLGGVAGVSALASTCFINAISPSKKRKRR